MRNWLGLGLCVFGAPMIASAATLTVGPGKTYQKVKDAVAAAKAGDTIEVDAGEYVDDISSIKVNDLTIRGVGGRPHLKATVPPPNKKGIFVIELGVGPVTLENLEFSGSRISEGDGNNGAGVRAQGTDLRVQGCSFHDNQNGILAGDGLMTVEGSEFAYNGEAGYEHNIYVGAAPKFVFRGNYTHHAKSGHALKSRALENRIEYNRLMEEADGNGSALIDLPQGGLSYVIGNLIQKGPNAENKNRVILYKGEGQTNPELRLYVSHNTFVNEGSPNVVFIDAPVVAELVVHNNLFVGPGTTIKAGGDPMPMVSEAGNLVIAALDGAGLVDRAGYDYRLVDGAMAIDMGAATDMQTAALWHYVHPTMLAERPIVGAPDVGAYEFGEAVGTTGDESSGGEATSEATTVTAGGETMGEGGEVGTAGEVGGTTAEGGEAGATAGEAGGSSEGDATTVPTSDGGTVTAGTAGGSTGDTSDASGDEGGCGCASDRRGGGWLLLVLGLGLRRRRSGPRRGA